MEPLEVCAMSSAWSASTVIAPLLVFRSMEPVPPAIVIPPLLVLKCKGPVHFWTSILPLEVWTSALPLPPRRLTSPLLVCSSTTAPEGTRTHMRSQTPEGVIQELYALSLAHYV